MGTVVTIDVYTAGIVTDRELAELRRQLDLARAVLARADEVFSTWQPRSAVSRLRAGEITIAQAPAEVAGVLERCALARQLSDGWFDPWAMPGGVDPTGYVKGWAAQEALAAFSVPSIAGAMVNAAGDLASFGGLGYGRTFRVGITGVHHRPRRQQEVDGALSVRARLIPRLRLAFPRRITTVRSEKMKLIMPNGPWCLPR
jgi:thiamine biosynthesis lipoprotein